MPQDCRPVFVSRTPQRGALTHTVEGSELLGPGAYDPRTLGHPILKAWLLDPEKQGSQFQSRVSREKGQIDLAGTAHIDFAPLSILRERCTSQHTGLAVLITHMRPSFIARSAGQDEWKGTSARTGADRVRSRILRLQA